MPLAIPSFRNWKEKKNPVNKINRLVSFFIRSSDQRPWLMTLCSNHLMCRGPQISMWECETPWPERPVDMLNGWLCQRAKDSHPRMFYLIHRHTVTISPVKSKHLFQLNVQFSNSSLLADTDNQVVIQSWSIAPFSSLQCCVMTVVRCCVCYWKRARFFFFFLTAGSIKGLVCRI